MGIAMMFWALIVLGVIALVRFNAGSQQRTFSPPTAPEQLLADRFARGEISETEYRDRLAVLRHHAHR
ncbi:SHOCT domain-containing protein [Mycobacterium avium]|uniref:SHOCT domain-containing protein n=1 Tax=Mycobacterium avium TaxID=1764 RepID=UPI000A012926